MASGIPITYVPARNTIFLSFAMAWAEVLKAEDIFIGVNALDYSGYPDCRPEYIEAYQQMANLATREGVETAFEPPSKSCLKMRSAWMGEPISDGAAPNNFQQVRKGKDGFTAMWGREGFVVRAVVRRSDGKIMQASMDNELTL